MACQLWGNGAKWGDGSLWCRQFGSSPYKTDPVDRQCHWLAVEVAYTGANSFIVDQIRPNIDWGRSQQAFTYNAWIDISTAARISTQVAYSGSGSFNINFINPFLNIKKHEPVG